MVLDTFTAFSHLIAISLKISLNYFQTVFLRQKRLLLVQFFDCEKFSLWLKYNNCRWQKRICEKKKDRCKMTMKKICRKTHTTNRTFYNLIEKSKETACHMHKENLVTYLKFYCAKKAFKNREFESNKVSEI